MHPQVDNPLWMLVEIYRFLKDSNLQDLSHSRSSPISFIQYSPNTSMFQYASRIKASSIEKQFIVSSHLFVHDMKMLDYSLILFRPVCGLVCHGHSLSD